MNYLKYLMAKAMVKHSIANSDFNPVDAETNISVDTAVPEYNNSYYFTGHSEKGEALMIRVAGRGNGSFEIWFSFYLPGKGGYSISTDVQKKVASFDESPVKLRCLLPEKQWNISFNGIVEGENGTEHVDFNVDLISDLPIFHFTDNMNPSAHAKAMAREKWTKEWFLTLKKMHQHHYEQGGNLKGSLVLSGEKHDLDMKYLRDHSFGPRSWAAMDRHLWLSVCLENGSFCNLSIPEYPFFKITCGFYSQQDKYFSVTGGPQFSDIVSNGLPDESFSYYMNLDNGKKYTIHCKRGTGFAWLMGDIYQVIEWISEFEIHSITW